MATKTQAYTTDDIEYLRHGAKPLMLRLFRPAGAGPHPLVIDLHGGAWCKGSFAGCQDRDEVLVASGLAVAALDFRQAGDGYPSSLVDINYAVRWLKAHAGDLNLDPGRVGLCGQSSGGHLAMLAAMRPNDSRYASLRLGEGGAAVDARVRCVGMAWPVINPLSRYRHALRALTGPGPAEWAAEFPEQHETYWKCEENMAEGNPVLALERGEKVETPPALWVQGRPDIVHDYRDPDSPVDANEPERFAHAYRKAGGQIEVVYIDQAARSGAASSDPLAVFFRERLS